MEPKEPIKTRSDRKQVTSKIKTPSEGLISAISTLIVFAERGHCITEIAEVAQIEAVSVEAKRVLFDKIEDDKEYEKILNEILENSRVLHESIELSLDEFKQIILEKYPNPVCEYLNTKEFW